MTKQFIPAFPEKSPVYFHTNCKNFNPETGKCIRRNVIVNKEHLACHTDLDLIDDTYQKIRCMHNDCDWTGGVEKSIGIKTYETENNIVQVEFFRCGICNHITAVHQLGGQHVIAVDPETEDVYDDNWLAAKISVAV
jgi:hypothetical protein